MPNGNRSGCRRGGAHRGGWHRCTSASTCGGRRIECGNTHGGRHQSTVMIGALDSATHRRRHLVEEQRGASASRASGAEGENSEE
jgi:hypothetical protein